jgi:carbon storage regulator
MLVLSRKRNERVHIGNNVYVTVIEIRGDKVRLGFEAPDGIPIHRGEVAEAILLSGESLPDLVSAGISIGAGSDDQS